MINCKNILVPIDFSPASQDAARYAQAMARSFGARDSKADLIIMPTHGYGPFRRFLIGSVTAKVLDDADLPVWTGVHFSETEKSFLHLKSVLCALDLGSTSDKVVAFASRLSAQFSAKLTQLHVTAERGGGCRRVF